MLVVHPEIIVTMDPKLRVLRDFYLGIEDGKIVYLGKTKPASADEILELPRRILMPGLINAHTHVAMTLLRGLKDDVDLKTWLMEYILPVEKLLRPSDVYYGALYGIAEMLMHGITCFLDMYYHELEVAKAVADAGIKAMVSYGSADVFFRRTPEEEFKIAERFRRELECLIRERRAEEHIFFAYGPHSPYGCTRELLEMFSDASRRFDIRIHIHLSETRTEVESIRKETGMTPIEYLDSIGLLSDRVMAAHVVWVSNHDMKILRIRRVHVLHNPSSNLKLASGICPVDRMIKSGINVALATDGPASNNRLDLWKEMHIASLLQKGITLDPTALPAVEAVKMATINGAKALGLEERMGSIEIGKCADFIILNLDRALGSTPIHDVYSMIVYALDSSCIESVWIHGRKLYDIDEGFATIDIDMLRGRLEDIRIRLVEEAEIAV